MLKRSLYTAATLHPLRAGLIAAGFGLASVAAVAGIGFVQMRRNAAKRSRAAEIERNFNSEPEMVTH